MYSRIFVLQMVKLIMQRRQTNPFIINVDIKWIQMKNKQFFSYKTKLCLCRVSFNEKRSSSFKYIKQYNIIFNIIFNLILNCHSHAKTKCYYYKFNKYFTLFESTFFNFVSFFLNYFVSYSNSFLIS